MTLYPTVNLDAKLIHFADNSEENRNDLRKVVIDRFIKEKAGQGSGEDTSKYKYIVEKLQTGNSIYLTRPVPLNKGFDFIIHIEQYIFQNNKDNPTHKDILDDLKLKKQKDIKAYKELIKAINEVFFCKDPSDIYLKYEKKLTSLKDGLLPELILKVAKWFFIEQDIRYWNWSGRNMLMNSMKTV